MALAFRCSSSQEQLSNAVSDLQHCVKLRSGWGKAHADFQFAFRGRTQRGNRAGLADFESVQHGGVQLQPIMVSRRGEPLGVRRTGSDLHNRYSGSGIEPFLDFSMAIGEGEAARAVVGASGHVVPGDRGVVLDPDLAPVLRDHPVLDLDRLVQLVRLCEPFEHAVAIIGMQHLSEEVLVRGPLLGGVTGQPLDLRAEVEAAGRAEIFDVHLARRGRDPAQFELEPLAEAAEGFSGAEIEAAVKAALIDAFKDGARDLSTGDVLARVRTIRPTSEVKREEIEELRRWARDHLAIDAVHGHPAAGDRYIEF